MPIRGVLFDVDDTLFDYSTSEQSGLLKHLAAHNLLSRFPTPATAVELWRTFTKTEYARFLAGELTFPEQQRSRTRQFLTHIGYVSEGGLSDEEASAWFAGYRHHYVAAWSAFTDAEPTLAQLAPSYRLGIVSNSSRDHQREKLDALGHLHYFGDAITCSDEHGVPKPDPSIFHAACASLRLEPHEVAYVGDNYTADAVGSHRAGLRSYWLNRSRLAPDASPDIAEGIRTIHTLTDLPAALTHTP
jgi:putative hydrolase of the HAD superfamily